MIFMTHIKFSHYVSLISTTQPHKIGIFIANDSRPLRAYYERVNYVIYMYISYLL